jgi:NAD(P)-dependent dehydrogenase (short-subunit alcohol dehydrogenase family)
MTGKVALVTGAGSGIGSAIAERLARTGAAVCVNYLGHEDAVRSLAARLPRAIAVRADVSVGEEVRALVERTRRELGTVDVLVNNAGIEREVPFLELDERTWEGP